jgi:AraC family transcriptional activator of pyochelin receptor
MMDGKWIEAIGAISGGKTEHQACRHSPLTYWQSSGRNAEPVEYYADLPAGLHFGCGLTAGIESIAEFGRMTVTGSGATLVVCHSGSRMTTRLAAGRFHSAGLTVSAGELYGFESLGAFAQSSGDACLALAAVPLSVIMRLATPIDPWFQGAARAMACEARALELLAVFEEALCGAPADGAATGRAEQTALEARTIIEHEYAAPPTIVALAARVGCSPRTLTEAFREAHGMSIGTYLTQLRLEHAKALLRDGVRPTEVAYRIGYSPAHFATVFKRACGMAPSRWRG